MQTVKITGEKRTGTRKVANSKLRKEDKIPAIIYGGGENHLFSTNAKDVKNLVYTPDFKLAEIDLDGTSYECILKDIQFHPVSDEIVHIDFLRLIDGTPIKYEVPIKFKGVSPGVKSGGKLLQQLRKVKVKSTPDKMVDVLYADISNLTLGSAIRVRDIMSNDNLQIENDPATPIAIVEVPRALKSATSATSKEAVPGAVAGAVAPAKKA
jgi:large subunit ribosomal protein L25